METWTNNKVPVEDDNSGMVMIEIGLLSNLKECPRTHGCIKSNKLLNITKVKVTLII